MRANRLRIRPTRWSNRPCSR